MGLFDDIGDFFSGAASSAIDVGTSDVGELGIAAALGGDPLLIGDSLGADAGLDFGGDFTGLGDVIGGATGSSGLDLGGDFTGLGDVFTGGGGASSLDIFQNVGSSGLDFGSLDPGTLMTDSGDIVGGSVATGGMVQTGVGSMIAGIGTTAASAILKLVQRMGGVVRSPGQLVSKGKALWASLSDWAAKNPGVSLVSTLVGLGLTAEEAAHFIAWGATKGRKRRRARGISGRDLRTTRRTIGKVGRMYRQLANTFSHAHFSARRAPRRISSGKQEFIRQG